MTTPMLRLLARGAIAGGAAGLLSAGVSFLLGEPSVNRAIELEEAGAHGAHAGAGAAPEHAEVFSRAAQQGGLLVVSVLTGIALGIFFAIAYVLIHRRDPDVDPWRRAMRLAGAGFVGVALIPFFRYPANPPAVGNPATVDARTTAYLLSILIGLAAVTAAWQLSDRLAERGVTPSLRQLAVVVVVLLGLAATWLLYSDTDTIEVPADLIWNFRLASIASLATLWLGLGAVFGLLGERAARTTGAQRSTAPAAP